MHARACNLPVVMIYICISAYNTYFYTLELIGKIYTTNTTLMSIYNNDRQISTKQRGCNVVVECEYINKMMGASFIIIILCVPTT